MDDTVSIVTNTTHNSDDTVLSVPRLHGVNAVFTGLSDDQTSSKKFSENSSLTSDFSPVLPFQTGQWINKVKTAPSIGGLADDTGSCSEMSEPLIPVLFSNNTRPVKTREEFTQVFDESQSLLPQAPPYRAPSYQAICLTSSVQMEPVDQGSEILTVADSMSLLDQSALSNRNVTEPTNNCTSIQNGISNQKKYHQKSSHEQFSQSVTNEDSKLTGKSVKLMSPSEHKSRASDESKTKSSSLSSSLVNSSYKNIVSIQSELLTQSGNSAISKNSSASLGSKTSRKSLASKISESSREFDPSEVYDRQLSDRQPKLRENVSKENVPMSQTERNFPERNVTPQQRETIIPISQREVILSASQGETTVLPTGEDTTDRLRARLDRLVSSLDKVPRRQMMVMEATITQCISSLQDSLHAKLKRCGYTNDNLGLIRRLLQATQASLTKLTELHKSERETLTQSMIQPSFSQSQLTQSSENSTFHGSSKNAIEDFSMRQKKVFGLLKRQKLLIELLKKAKSNKGKRSDDAEISKEKKEIPSQGDIKGTNDNKRQTSCLKSETSADNGNNMTKMTTRAKNKRQIHTNRKYDVTIFVDQNKPMKEDKAKTETNVMKPGNIKALDLYRDGLKSIPAAKVTEFEQSQEVTTIPETQEMNTQDTLRTSGRDMFSDRENDAGNEETLCKHITNRQQGVEVLHNETTSKDSGDLKLMDNENDQNKTGKEIETVNKCVVKESKEDIIARITKISQEASGSLAGSLNDDNDDETVAPVADDDIESFENDKNPKEKDRQNDQITVTMTTPFTAVDTKVAIRKDVNSDKQTGMKPYSEMLWLNMLKDSKPKENSSLVNKKAYLVKRVKVPGKRESNDNDTEDLYIATKLSDNLAKPLETQYEYEPTSAKLHMNACEDLRADGIFSEGLASKRDKEKQESIVGKWKQESTIVKGKQENKPSEQEQATIKQLNIPSTSNDKDQILMSPPMKRSKPDIIELTSPPTVRIPGETWDVSPTATSMSSDVFLVKAKELERRMKRRAEFTQENILGKLKPQNNTELNCPQNEEKVISKRNDLNDEQLNKTKLGRNVYGIFTQTAQNHFSGSDKNQYCKTKNGGKMSVNKDTISDAIDSVILKSREHAEMQDGQKQEVVNQLSFQESSSIQTKYAQKPVISSQFPADSLKVFKQSEIQNQHMATGFKRPEQSTQVPNKPANKTESLLPVQRSRYVPPTSATCSASRETYMTTSAEVCASGRADFAMTAERHFYGETGQPTQTFSRVPKQIPTKTAGALLTLKELLSSGKLSPGKNVLSVISKDQLYKASVTPQGKIRTSDGLVFATVSQWLSSLNEGETVKKRKAYQMVNFKGQPIINYCTSGTDHTLACADQHVNPTSCIIPAQEKRDQSVQVDANFEPTQHAMTAAERWLNDRLSNAVVRLLKETDFVTNDDLPPDFWQEDYSKVKLPQVIWQSVNCW